MEMYSVSLDKDKDSNSHFKIVKGSSICEYLSYRSKSLRKTLILKGMCFTSQAFSLTYISVFHFLNPYECWNCFPDTKFRMCRLSENVWSAIKYLEIHFLPLNINFS